MPGGEGPLRAAFMGSWLMSQIHSHGCTTRGFANYCEVFWECFRLFKPWPAGGRRPGRGKSRADCLAQPATKTRVCLTLHSIFVRPVPGKGSPGRFKEAAARYLESKPLAYHSVTLTPSSLAAFS